MFEHLQHWGLCLHYDKCNFFYDKLSYLEDMIILGSLGVQQAKKDVLHKIQAPCDVPQLRAFLGLANYYWRFQKNFSQIAKPLTILTSKDQLWT